MEDSIHGRAETRNFSSRVEKHSTGERSFELLHMKCMMGSSRNAWSFCARRAAIYQPFTIILSAARSAAQLISVISNHSYT